MSMQNASDTIGHRSRELPACSAVPEATAPLRDLYYKRRRVNHVQITDGNRRAVFSPCNFVNLQQEETKRRRIYQALRA